jgi:hypothetical protein
MPDAVKTMLFMGVLVLATAFLVGPLSTYATTDASQTLELRQNDSVEVTDTLSVTALDVNQSNSTTQYQITDEDTLATNQTRLSVSQGSVLLLSGDNITVSLDSIESSVSVTEVEYPPMFGWDDGPRTVISNLPIILTLIMFTALVGYMVRVINS